MGAVSGFRGSVLLLRFVCELGMLAALMYWGFTAGDGAWAWVLGIGAPALAGLAWGLFVAPKARRPVSLAIRLSIETDLFVVSAIALWFSGQPALGVTLGVVGVLTSVLNAVTEPRGPDLGV